jgi:GNAT superfamily N-acetyltransferase
LAGEAALLALQAQEDWGIDAVKLAALRAGDQCLLSLVDDRPAGYTWVHSRGLPEILPGLWLRLPQGWLYNFAAYTHPAFRGSGLQSWRHAAVLQHPAWQGCAGLVGWVRATNHASRRGQRKSGYVPAGWIVRVGLGPWQVTLSSSSLARRGLVCLPAPMRPAAAAPAR